jgi:hypothetical protein
MLFANFATFHFQIPKGPNLAPESSSISLFGENPHEVLAAARLKSSSLNAPQTKDRSNRRRTFPFCSGSKTQFGIEWLTSSTFNQRNWLIRKLSSSHKIECKHKYKSTNCQRTPELVCTMTASLPFGRLIATVPASKTDDKLTALPQTFIPDERHIILGRGKVVSQHAGNKKLQSLVSSKLSAYAQAPSKTEKSAIVSGILKTLTAAASSDSQGYHGFFVKQDAKSGAWFACNEMLAREKISQTFRDNLTEKYQSSKKRKQQKRKIARQEAKELAASESDDSSTTSSDNGVYKKRKFSTQDLGSKMVACSTSEALRQLVQFSHSVLHTSIQETKDGRPSCAHCGASEACSHGGSSQMPSLALTPEAAQFPPAEIQEPVQFPPAEIVCSTQASEHRPHQLYHHHEKTEDIRPIPFHRYDGNLYLDDDGSDDPRYEQQEEEVALDLSYFLR